MSELVSDGTSRLEQSKITGRATTTKLKKARLRAEENKMALPTIKKASSSGEYTPLEAGTYEATLKRIDLEILTEFETKQFNNGDGLRFQGCTMIWDIEGEEYRDRFIKISLNNRAKFFNRISALLGRDVEDDADTLGWGLSEHAIRDAEYDDYFRANNADFYEAKEEGRFGTYKLEDAKLGNDGKPVVKVKKGEYLHLGHKHDGVVGTLDSLTVNGENLYGKGCLLVLKVNGQYNKSEAGAASPLPRKQARRPVPAGAPA